MDRLHRAIDMLETGMKEWEDAAPDQRFNVVFFAYEELLAYLREARNERT